MRLDHAGDQRPHGQTRVDVFGDALGFDHDQVRAGIHKAEGLADRPTRVLRALGFKFFCSRCATCPELNANFGLCLHAGFLNAFDEVKPVICRQRDEAADCRRLSGRCRCLQFG